MKNLYLPSLIIILNSILVGCEREECFTPPQPVVLEFVDGSGANLLSNGSLNSKKIIIQEDNGNGTLVNINHTLREDNKIMIKDNVWKEGLRNYDVYLTMDSIRTFKFKTETSKFTGKCSGYELTNVQVENIPSTKENGYFKIIID